MYMSPEEMMKPDPILADLEFVPAEPCLCVVELPFSTKTEFSYWDGKQWMAASDDPVKAAAAERPSFIQRRAWQKL